MLKTRFILLFFVLCKPFYPDIHTNACILIRYTHLFSTDKQKMTAHKRAVILNSVVHSGAAGLIEHAEKITHLEIHIRLPPAAAGGTILIPAGHIDLGIG